MRNINRGFVALHRGEVVDSLQEQYPEAFLLLCQIARRARVEACPILGLEKGEALIGDWKKAGLKSERRYRTAKKRLETCRISTFRATAKGTIAKLVDTSVFSNSLPSSDEQSDRRVTGNRRTGDGQATTKNNDNKENNENHDKHTGPQAGVCGSEFIDKINRLRPGWRKPAALNQAERELMAGGSAEQMAELSEADWAMLGRFMRYKPKPGEDYWQPNLRRKFIETFDSVFISASNWAYKHEQPKTNNNPNNIWR